MKNIINIIIATIFLLAAIACNREKQEHNHENHGHGEHGSHHEGEHDHNEDEITLTSSQIKSINLKIDSIKSVFVSEQISTNGELELAPQNRASIHVLMNGIISEIYVIEGNKVKKGDVLASITHPDIIKLQEDYINQFAQLGFLEKEYNRQKKLYNEQVGAGKNFQKVQADYNGAKALVFALKAKLKMLGISPQKIINGNITETIYVRSPLNGKVSLVETNIGEFVSTNKKLFEVVDNHHIHADFRIYEKDISKVKEGQTVEFHTSSLPSENFTATIYAISPAFEESPKSLHIHAELPEHDDRLIPGMFISGIIKSDSSLKKVVPRSAIASEGDKKFIFLFKEKVKAENNHGHDHGDSKTRFIRTEIKAGLEQGDWVEILNTELPEGTKITTSAYYLLAEMGKAETEHSH